MEFIHCLAAASLVGIWHKRTQIVNDSGKAKYHVYLMLKIIILTHTKQACLQMIFD